MSASEILKETKEKLRDSLLAINDIIVKIREAVRQLVKEEIKLDTVKEALIELLGYQSKYRSPIPVGLAKDVAYMINVEYRTWTYSKRFTIEIIRKREETSRDVLLTLDVNLDEKKLCIKLERDIDTVQHAVDNIRRFLEERSERRLFENTIKLLSNIYRILSTIRTLEHVAEIEGNVTVEVKELEKKLQWIINRIIREIETELD